MAIADANLKVDEATCDQIGVVIGTGIGGLGTLYEQCRYLQNEGHRASAPF